MNYCLDVYSPYKEHIIQEATVLLSSVVASAAYGDEELEEKQIQKLSNLLEFYEFGQHYPSAWRLSSYEEFSNTTYPAVQSLVETAVESNILTNKKWPKLLEKYFKTVNTYAKEFNQDMGLGLETP